MKLTNQDDRRLVVYIGAAFAVLAGGLILGFALLKADEPKLAWAVAVLVALPGVVFTLYMPVSRARPRWRRVVGLALLSSVVVGYAGLTAAVAGSDGLLPVVVVGALSLMIVVSVALTELPRPESVTCAAGPLRDLLAGAVRSRVSITQEPDRFTLQISGHLFAGSGDTVDAAIADLAQSLRRYASDWESDLKDVSSHRGSWGLVQLTKLSTDDQLREWLAVGPRRRHGSMRAE